MPEKVLITCPSLRLCRASGFRLRVLGPHKPKTHLGITLAPIQVNGAVRSRRGGTPIL